MENRKEKGVFKKNFTFVSRRELIVTINRELKISYKVTNKTKIQTFLNIRKKKKNQLHSERQHFYLLKQKTYDTVTQPRQNMSDILINANGLNSY